jgi:dihydroxyacetone kinase DhaKLM complex PTS-EIIA-like component DhaM
MSGKSKTPLRPTVVVPPDRTSKPGNRKARSPETGQRAAAPVTTPTAIVGVEPARIDVTVERLRKLSPGVRQGVVEGAMRLVAGVVPAKLTDRKAIMWGHELQQTYGTLVADTLTLSQAPLFRKVESYLTRMMDILQSVDIMAACGHDEGGVGSLFKGVNSRIDRPSELKAACGELDQLVRLMNGTLKELLAIKEKLESFRIAMDNIAVDVEGAALAALYLSEHARAGNPTLAQRLVDRSISLTQTLSQIRAGSSVRDIQIEHPIRMVGAIQNVALVAMPDLLTSVAAVTSLAGRASGISRTAAGELKYKIDAIIGQLAT